MDLRIPLRFTTRAEAKLGDALLIEGDAPRTTLPCQSFTLQETGHALGCLCCAPRSAAGLALAALFTGRATARVDFKTVAAVVSSEAGRQAILDALRDDPVASARFRLVS